MKNIVIFGAPGSGKGTQSDKMIEKYGLNHISTGDVLRSEIKNGTELGMTAKGFIDNGQLTKSNCYSRSFWTQEFSFLICGLTAQKRREILNGTCFENQCMIA